MVGVDYVVARLDVGQFLEAQGQLAGTGSLALERILVEAVENLMVGEDAAVGYMVTNPA